MAEPQNNADDAGFLTRWSRRKATVREGHAVPAAPPTSTEAPEAAWPRENLPPVATSSPPPPQTPPPPAAPAQPPPPTMDEVAGLTPASDFRRFVSPDVAPDVRNAALKQLFADPHFNVMDGLDTYIDDYGKPDPLPLGMLRKMAQAHFLNLFADEKKAQDDPPAAPANHLDTPADEDPDLRLQPHDAAGPPGTEPGPGEDAGGER